jgi:hypothetical protein
MSRKLAVLAVVLAGCTGGGNFGQLSQADKDLFFRCMTPTQAIRCGSDTDPMYLTFCNRDGQAKFADIPTGRGRKEWLVANGCPPSMVQPQRFIADDETPAPGPETQAHTTSPTPERPRNSPPAKLGAGWTGWSDPFE